MKNITKLEYLETAFIYDRGVEKIILNSEPQAHAETFRSCLFHADFLIRDFYYQVASEAVDAILDIAERDEQRILDLTMSDILDRATIDSDCYHSELLQWAQENTGEAFSLGTEAIEEGAKTLFEVLSCAQIRQKEEIYSITLTAIQHFLSA